MSHFFKLKGSLTLSKQSNPNWNFGLCLQSLSVWCYHIQGRVLLCFQPFPTGIYGRLGKFCINYCFKWQEKPFGLKNKKSGRKGVGQGDKKKQCSRFSFGNLWIISPAVIQVVRIRDLEVICWSRDKDKACQWKGASWMKHWSYYVQGWS